MIRLLSAQIESVQTAFFRALISVILLLPMIAAGRVKPWQSKRIAGHFWRTLMGTVSMVLGFYAVTLLPLADATAVALSILLVKRLSDSEPPLMILTQFAIFSTLLLAVPAILVWRWPD